MENAKGEGHRAIGGARLLDSECYGSRFSVGRSFLWAHGRTLPGDPERLYLNLAPIYDPAATFTAGLVLQGTYPRPIHAFLTGCTAAKAPKSRWRSIKARYDILIEEWQAKMDLDSWFRREMAGAEERILRGEEQEVVLQDLRKRLEERYGEALDATSSDIRSGDAGAMSA